MAAVTVTDPYTVVFELKKPFAPLLAALAERPGFMVSPAAVEQAGADFGRRPVGTGTVPLRREWVADSQLTLERFPDYWDKGQTLPRPGHLPHRPGSTVQAHHGADGRG